MNLGKVFIALAPTANTAPQVLERGLGWSPIVGNGQKRSEPRLVLIEID
jgi:hypothetical protein